MGDNGSNPGRKEKMARQEEESGEEERRELEEMARCIGLHCSVKFSCGIQRNLENMSIAKAETDN